MNMKRPYKLLISNSKFEIPAPSQQSVVGVLIVSAICLAMIIALKLLVVWIKQ